MQRVGGRRLEVKPLVKRTCQRGYPPLARETYTLTYSAFVHNGRLARGARY
jgi:hypothetical protein